MVVCEIVIEFQILIRYMFSSEPRQQTYYNKTAVSVREIGYQEDKNYSSRMNMEDGTCSWI